MNLDLIKAVEAPQMKDGAENFRIGDTIKVYFKIIEGKTERIQPYEGTAIALKHGGIQRTVTVRKVAFGVGVEKVFPLNSPRIEKIEVIRTGKVRRSKLYYL
ncbi:MAG: 50S ribosomal protein L19, partial [Spirochaetes bacterium GWB1_48_6]